MKAKSDGAINTVCFDQVTCCLAIVLSESSTTALECALCCDSSAKDTFKFFKRGFLFKMTLDPNLTSSLAFAKNNSYINYL